MTTSGKGSNKNPVASSKTNLPAVAIPATLPSTDPLLVPQSPTPARQSRPSLQGTEPLLISQSPPPAWQSRPSLPSSKPLLVSQSPTPAWQSKPPNPYLRTKVNKSEPEQVRLHRISTFVSLASSYIDILLANDTRIATTPWYYLWTTWVKKNIIGTQQISTVSSIIDYPKSKQTTLRNVAEFILEKLPVLHPYLIFHKNTKRDATL